MLAAIFLVFALVLFILAAVNMVPDPPRPRLLAAGLAFAAAAAIAMIAPSFLR